MLSPERRVLRGRIAALSQTRPPDHPDLIAARDQLAVVKLEDHIRKLVENAPPLSETQRARLAALLLPAKRGAAA